MSNEATKASEGKSTLTFQDILMKLTEVHETADKIIFGVEKLAYEVADVPVDPPQEKPVEVDSTKGSLKTLYFRVKKVQIILTRIENLVNSMREVWGF